MEGILRFIYRKRFDKIKNLLVNYGIRAIRNPRLFIRSLVKLISQKQRLMGFNLDYCVD